ncbi:MAG: glycosyltransferase family 39 protein [Nitrososphaerales archaeon]
MVWRDMNRGSVIFLATLLVFCVTLNAVWATDHTASFLDLDYAIWANHTFALGRVGQFIPNSVDIFQYRGQYYSALAPGLALFAFPFVVPGFIIVGHFSEYGAVMLSSEFFVAMLNALAVLYLYKLSRMYFREATASFIALAYAFSTVSWSLATFFFQSDASAALDIVAVYLVLRATRGSRGSITLLLGGLSVAAAMMVDYVNFLLMPVLLVYIVVSLRRKNRGLLAKAAVGFALCSFLGVLAIGLYNYASFGQVLVSSEQLYLHSSSLLGEFSTPWYLGVVLNLFTPLRGIFLYSPILLVGVFGFRKMLDTSAVRREGLLILAAFMVLFLPYCAWYDPTGGLSFGPRFIVASLPFLLLPAGYVIEGGWRYRGPVVYVLYSAGVVVNGLAALTSTLAGNTSWLSSPFLDSTIPLLSHGTLDQWWTGSVGLLWPVVAGAVVATALLLPDILRRGSERGPDPADEPARIDAGQNRIT